MKSNLARTIIEWAAAASLVLSIILFVQHSFRSRELRRLQSQHQQEMMKLQQNRMFIQSVVGDCLEYRKSNPSIDPVLKATGLIPNEPAPSKPAAR